MEQDIFKTLAAQRTVLEGKLAEERTARGEYALAAAGGNKDAQRGVEQAEAEIKRLLNLIERNDDARRTAEAQQSAAGIARTRAATKAAGQRAVKAALARVALAKRLDAVFAEAGELLKQYGATSSKIREDLRVVVDAAELAPRQRTALLERLHGIANGPAGAALTNAIAANGIGREGVRHSLLADLRASDGKFAFVDVAEIAADRVAQLAKGV